MKITIFASGFCIDNGKSTQRGACAARLLYADDEGRNAVRIISEPVGNSTKPQCDLKAAMLGLMSLKSTVRNAAVDVFVPSYVAQLMEREGGNYKLEPKKNAELVRRLREKVTLFKNIIIQTGSKEDLRQPMVIAKTAAEIGAGDDSGTIML